MARVATTVGLYPLPDWAKDDLSELKGHQKEDLISGDESEEVAATYEQACAEVLERQRDANLDRIVEGQLRWDDMLGHPLAVHDAVETGGIVRYYDNNNFYRELVVTDDLAFDGTIADELDGVASHVPELPLQAVLPGPYSLATLACDEYYGDDRDFLSAIGDFLAAEAAELPAVETVFVLEPSLSVNPPTTDGLAVETSAVTDALTKVANAVEADVIVHTYWGTLSADVYTAVLNAAVDGVGHDLVTDAEATVQTVGEYGALDAVALGVVDGQNTRIESLQDIEKQVTRFQEVASVDTTYLTTNTELFYLPVAKANAKLDVLGRAATAPEVDA